MILLIDNYDSFSYNLYQLVGAIDPDIRVIRNDELRIEEIDALHPARIILSPGPGRSEDAGVLIDVVKTLSPRIPTLGVCLGHQAICAAFGATVTYDWSLVRSVQRPYFLAGGLDPDNVADAIAALHPYGVDVSSGIETDGVKDESKMAAFVAAARKEG